MTVLPAAYRCGIQTFAAQDNPLYTAVAARLPQTGVICRTWSKYLERPSAGHITTCLNRQSHGARTILQLTGCPEGAGPPEDLGLPPPDVAAWLDQAQLVIQDFLDGGVVLDAVSVWNEPDIGGHWDGTDAEFYALYCQIVPELQRRFPALAIGGPSVARVGAKVFEWWSALFDACNTYGVYPQYFGMHQYQGFSTDLSRFGLATRLRDLYVARTGRPQAEAAAIPIMLDEWNFVVPNGNAHELDDERAAALFLTTVLSLEDAGFDGHSFFFLSDGNWESLEDYDHKSVGIFTLNRGPKALWSALKMLEEVVAFGPREPVTRLTPAWSTGVYAAKNGSNQRRVLIANSARLDSTSPLRYLEFNGVDVGSYDGQEGLVKAYANGTLSYAETGFPPEDEATWAGAVKLWKDYNAAKDGPIPVSLQFDAPMRSVSNVRIIDHTRGNPSYWFDQVGSSYRNTFLSYRSGSGATLDNVLDHPDCAAQPLTDLTAFQLDGRRLIVLMQPDTSLAFTLTPA